MSAPTLEEEIAAFREAAEDARSRGYRQFAAHWEAQADLLERSPELAMAYMAETEAQPELSAEADAPCAGD